MAIIANGTSASGAKTGKKREGGGSLGDWDYLGNKLDDQFFPDTSDSDAAALEALKNSIAQYTNLAPADLKGIDYSDIFNGIGDLKPVASVTAPRVNGGKDVSYEGIDPRLSDLSLAGPSDYNDISVDPRLKDSQTASLDALRDIANNGGMTAADEANLNRIQSEVASADRGRRDAIGQNMTARGMGGSGLELLEMLKSNQDATNRANQSGLDIAGMAEQRALDAMMNGGNLAGSIRGQDFDEQAKVAEANDAINRFNATNSNQSSQFNAGTVNNMGQFNAGNALKTNMYNRDTGLDVAKTNAGYDFDAQKTNAGAANDAAGKTWAGKQQAAADTATYNDYKLPQQQFENNMGVAKGKADAYGREQDYWNSKTAQTAGGGAAKAGLVGSVIGMFSDKRMKKDVSSISDGDIDEFLTAVQPKKFRYKNPGNPGQPAGDRAGFMLQDVADTKLGKTMTKKDPEGRLFYDKDNLDGIILAALSSLAKEKKRA